MRSPCLSWMALVLAGAAALWQPPEAAAGRVTVEPRLTGAAGHDGNYFYAQEISAQTAVSPARLEAGAAVDWRPTLRWGLSAAGYGSVERLYANPVLGTLEGGGAETAVRFRPSYWSRVDAGAWIDRYASTDPALRFLSTTTSGLQAGGAYRFSTFTLGAVGGLSRAQYTSFGRSDTLWQAGPWVEVDAAGRWRADVRYQRTASSEPSVAGAGPYVALGYRHALWPGGRVDADASVRQKMYDIAGRDDVRWRFGGGLGHAWGETLDLGFRIDRTINTSSAPGESYHATTWTCFVSVHPSWSYSY